MPAPSIEAEIQRVKAWKPKDPRSRILSTMIEHTQAPEVGPPLEPVCIPGQCICRSAFFGVKGSHFRVDARHHVFGFGLGTFILQLLLPGVFDKPWASHVARVSSTRPVDASGCCDAEPSIRDLADEPQDLRLEQYLQFMQRG